MRHDTPEELHLLNELYWHLRLYSNHFHPVMKLLEKTRVGSKVKKKYDKPQTPCQRVMASPHIPKEVMKWLSHEHDKLNPTELKRNITRLQNRLIRYASSKGKRKPSP